jgi:signal peptidase I
VNKWSYGWRIPFTASHFLPEKVRRGDVVLFNNPIPADKETPVFARSLYISRCVGVPGDTLMLNRELMVTGSRFMSPDSKQLYAYPHEWEDSLQHAMHQLGIEENPLVGYTEGRYVRSFSHYEHYLLKQRLGQGMDIRPVHGNDTTDSHPLILPAKGKPVRIYPWNATLLCNTILHHEGRNASVKNDTLWVDGKPVMYYIFRKDYYWMASNNPVNLSDSRLFGLVPHDHLVGRASYIWYSHRKERIFQPVQ